MVTRHEVLRVSCTDLPPRALASARVKLYAETGNCDAAQLCRSALLIFSKHYCLYCNGSCPVNHPVRDLVTSICRRVRGPPFAHTFVPNVELSVHRLISTDTINRSSDRANECMLELRITSRLHAFILADFASGSPSEVSVQCRIDSTLFDIMSRQCKQTRLT